MLITSFVIVVLWDTAIVLFVVVLQIFTLATGDRSEIVLVKKYKWILFVANIFQSSKFSSVYS